jgi:hypothetical protein
MEYCYHEQKLLGVERWVYPHAKKPGNGWISLVDMKFDHAEEINKLLKPGGTLKIDGISEVVYAASNKAGLPLDGNIVKKGSTQSAVQIIFFLEPIPKDDGHFRSNPERPVGLILFFSMMTSAKEFLLWAFR